MRSDLLPLISEPREDLAVEYKTWLDLGQEKHKATLAKACIALANHGGGFLVLGFDEDGDSLNSVARPTAIAEITQDAINSIVRRYADPPFHCQLNSIPHPQSSVVHPVISVPSDQSFPVISKRNCHGAIQQHRCYVRKPGPISEDPKTAEEWRTLFRRCALVNREEMLSAIRSIMIGRAETELPESSSIQEFADFRTTSFERWSTITKDVNPESPERFPNGYYEMSIHFVDATPAEDLSVLKQRLSQAQRIKLTGWTPFLEMEREAWRPYPFEDHIEAWIGRPVDDRTLREPQFSDYWRASRKGQLYTIRGYTEDSLENHGGVRRGSVIDVTFPVWRVGEILFFAARFLDAFEDARAVLVNCRFTGLAERTITSLDFSRRTSSRPCLSDEVQTGANVTPQQLQENVVEVVHQLLSPIYAEFDFYTLSRILVEEELSSLRGNRF